MENAYFFQRLALRRNKSFLKFFGLLAVMLLVVNGNVWGQVNISAGSTITQNFSIGTSATATLPSGWKVDKNATVRTVGTYAGAVSTTEKSDGNSMSTTAANGIYNYGAGAAASATDRAIGGLSSKSESKSVNVYVQLTNNGSAAISNFSLSPDYALDNLNGKSNTLE